MKDKYLTGKKMFLSVANKPQLKIDIYSPIDTIPHVYYINILYAIFFTYIESSDILKILIIS